MSKGYSSAENYLPHPLLMPILYWITMNICGAFLKRGCPSIIHLNGIFHYKPSSYWGTSIYGTPHFYFHNWAILAPPLWRCWKWRPSRLVANGLEDVNTSRHVICSGPAKIGTPCQKPGNNREPCQRRTWDTAFWKFRLMTLRINMGTHRLAALRNQKRAVLRSLSWREGTTKSWQSQMWTQKITWPLPTHPHPLCLNPQCLGVWMSFSHWSCRLFGIRDIIIISITITIIIITIIIIILLLLLILLTLL